MARLRVLPIAETVPEVAFGQAPTLRRHAMACGDAVLGTYAVTGRCVALGAHQRAGRVVDRARCASEGVTVLRRAAAGTALWIDGRALVWVLALPSVDALFPDAQPDTVFNRNVRGFLRALSRGGETAAYFGREWIAVRHRPLAVLALDAGEDGSVAIEVTVALDSPLGLPDALVTETERQFDRWRGNVPLTWSALHGPGAASPAEAAPAAIAARCGAEMVPESITVRAEPCKTVRDDDDPAPRGTTAFRCVPCPIGGLDLGRAPDGTLWLGGDLLAPRFALDTAVGRFVRGERPVIPAGVPFEGVRERDLVGTFESSA